MFLFNKVREFDRFLSQRKLKKRMIKVLEEHNLPTSNLVGSDLEKALQLLNQKKEAPMSTFVDEENVSSS